MTVDTNSSSSTAPGGRVRECAQLQQIEQFFDASPRTDAVAEEVGPFTLFKSTFVWPYYARPQLGGAVEFTAQDIAALRARCDQLGLPLALEWVAEIAPTLATAATEFGLTVSSHALLALTPSQFTPNSPPQGVTVEHLATDDPRFALARAVAEAAFGVGGTEIGSAGPVERDALAADVSREHTTHMARRREAELTFTAVAMDERDGVVAVGSYQPVANEAELLAVATLPSHRRRGLAGAVSSSLVADAFDRGINLVLLSAQDDAVARVYERVGFRRVGTARQAEANEQ